MIVTINLAVVLLAVGIIGLIGFLAYCYSCYKASKRCYTSLFDYVKGFNAGFYVIITIFVLLIVCGIVCLI